MPKLFDHAGAETVTLFFFSIRIYFIRISRLKFAKFLEYFKKNKAGAEILKRIGIVLLKHL